MVEFLISLTGKRVTHDESEGLQTGGIATPTEDNNDDDVLFSSVPLVFSSRLAQLTLQTPVGAAASDGNVVNSTGGPLSLTGANGAALNGADSGLNTIAGDSILLFTDPTNDNIVLGRVGGPAGEIAFAIYLEEVAGNPPGGKLWLVQYTAIDHGPDGGNHDAALTIAPGVLYVTAVTSLDIGGVVRFEDDGPSIELTPSSPAIAVDESVGPDPADPNAADETNPSAPAGAIGFAQVAAASLFTESADAGTDGEDATVYSVVLNAGATGLTDTASGEAVVLVSNGGVVEGRTQSGGDLVFTITVNGATGDVEVAQFRALDHGDDGNDHDSAVSMAGGLVELQATLTDGDTDTASDKIELGSLIRFEDDGPALEAVTDNVIVDFVANAGAGDPNLGLGYGSDGPGGLAITSFEAMPDDTILGVITETLSADGTVLTYSSDELGDLFRLSLDSNEPGAYMFAVLQDGPLVLNTLDFAGADPGGPVEEVTITAPGGTDVTFDGFRIANFNAAIKPQFATGDLATSADDVNVSQKGVGLKDNQMDALEALKLSFDPDVEGVRILFDGATGGGNTFRIKVEGYDSGGALMFQDFSQEAAPKGNSELEKQYLFGAEVDEVYIALQFDTPSSGVRIAEISTIERGDAPDFELDYVVTADDGDGDFVTTAFTVGIDGDHDGVIVA